MDFDHWFLNQKPHKEAHPEPELPEGVWESGQDEFSAKCCMCHQDFVLPDGLQSVKEGSDFYCFGSYRCCP